MSSDTNTIVAFDLYGTLLSTASIAKQLAEHFGADKAGALAADWRRYQLEYTWRLNSMDQYSPFSTITRRSLSHALASHNLELPESATDALMRAYDSLSTFPDVAPALRTLAQTSRITPVVFSNGTAAMIEASVRRSPDLSPHAEVFQDLVTVEECKRFKPDPQVYKMLAKRVGKEGKMGDMWLVSGNPFDVVGARAVGMQAAWVDREGNGWVDGLVEGEVGRPTCVCKGLEEVVAEVKRRAGL